MKQTKTFKTKTNLIINWLISLFIFPYTGILCYKSEKKIIEIAKERNVSIKDLSIVSLICGLIGLGIVSYIIEQSQLNKISKTYKEN